MVQTLQQIAAALTAVLMSLSAQVGNIANSIPATNQLAQVAAPTSGLVGHWKFDEGSGTSAADSSGSGNNAALFGSPSWITGKVGSGALSFNGSNYVKAPNSASLRITNDFTISAWIKRGAINVYSEIINKVDAPDADYEFYINDQNQLQFYAATLSPQGATASGTLNDTASWHHVLVVRNGNTTTFYVDGSQRGSATQTGSMSPSNRELYIGSITPQGYGYWTGALDEVRIYNRALSSSEISNIYNDTGTTPPPPPPPTLIAPSISSFSASPSSITSGQSSTLSWSVSGNPTPTLSLNQGIGAVTGTSRSVSPTVTTAYTLIATNSQGSANANTTVTITAVPPPTPINGSCGTTVNACTTGTFSDVTDTSSNYLWNCLGSNGGSNSSCSLAIPPPPPPPTGSNFYVSPSGLASGNGSIGSPWNLQTALNQPSAVQPGATIWLRGGTYTGLFTNNLNGTVGNPITIRNYNGERAIIDAGQGNSASKAVLTLAGSYQTIWGLEIMSSDSHSRSTSQAGSWPTNIYRGSCIEFKAGTIVTGAKIINNVIHDCALGLGFWGTEGVGTESYGNIVYNNGWRSTADGNHGHGAYIQNQTGTKTYTDNLFFENYSLGAQTYTQDGYADNITLRGNVIWQNGVNFIVGGGKSNNHDLIVDSNIVYCAMRDGWLGSTGFDMGNYPYGGMSNSSVTSNIVRQCLAPFGNLTATPVNNNSIYGYAYFKGNNTTNLNTAYGGTGNTVTDQKPSTNEIYVKPNQYEPGKGFIVIMNWQNLANVSVSASGILSSGDNYEIRNAQNYFNEKISGTYNGTSISVPMNIWTVVKPIGDTANPYPPSLPEFGAFVLVKTGSGTPPPSDTTSPSVPTNLSATAVSPSQINLSWNASTDNIGVTGYDIYRGGTLLTSVTGTTYSNTGLSASTQYSYTVRSKDAAGNTSAQSSSASATTQAAAIPPSTKFTIGQRIQTTSNLNVRATASASGTLLGTQSLGALGTIVSGGQSADGYYWWNVNYDSGVDGYSIEDYLTPYSAPIIGDFNLDGLVNSIDLSLMTSAWNTSNATYDLNHDSVVNSLDYVIMVQNWTP